MAKTTLQSDRWVVSTCKMCLHGCGIRVNVKDGVVIKIEGDPKNVNNNGKICAKAHAGILRLYDPNRIKTPLKRTNPEKGRGVDPKWVPISWEEAYETVGKKLKEVVSSDPRKLICAINDFQRIHLWGWGAAAGSPHYFTTVGQYCGAAYHPMNGALDGSFASVNDYIHCNYWIQVGSGDGFNSHLHVAPSIKRMADARVNRGMKVVSVDPRMGPPAVKADEWIATRPATDRAFVLGMVHVLLHELGIYDAEFIKKRTNGPYLVAPDGNLYRDPATKKAMMWDTEDQQAKVFDDPTLKDYALLGTYSVNGTTCRTAFQEIMDVMKDHTPEKMAKVCSVSAETIRRIATEFGEAARIGSTIVIDGKEYPYRPAALNFYRGGISHFDGGLDCMAFKLINLIIGNIDVPGGHIGVGMDHRLLWIQPGPDGMLMPQPHMLHPPVEFADPPNSFQLMEWFPLGIDPGHLNSETILNPEKYGFNYKPEMMLLYHTNPLWNTPGTEGLMEVMRQMDLIVAIDILPNESTEWADIVLPDHTYLESTLLVCLEPPEITGHTVRQPVIEPMYDTKEAGDILTELAYRGGFLDRWNGLLNFVMGFYQQEEYMLKPEVKYSQVDMLDRMAKVIYGKDKGLEWFKENGQAVRYLKPEEKYLPFGDLRIPIYFNYIKEVGEDLLEKFRGVGKDWDISSYSPVPFWRDINPVHNESAEYDLYAITFKEAILNFAENTTIPWVQEIIKKLPVHSGIMINSKTAQRKGINDGDRIRVASKFAEIEGIAKLTEEIHPEVLGFSNGISRWTIHPVERRMNCHFNSLLGNTLEYTDKLTGSLESAAKVKITKIS